MGRRALEVADIFRDYGPAWRDANHGHVSLGQLKAMSAIERCRTAALGGYLVRGEMITTPVPTRPSPTTAAATGTVRSPKCQGAAAREWIEVGAAELLPVPYLSGAAQADALVRLRQAPARRAQGGARGIRPLPPHCHRRAHAIYSRFHLSSRFAGLVQICLSSRPGRKMAGRGVPDLTRVNGIVA
jgi:hypothetical protein